MRILAAVSNVSLSPQCLLIFGGVWVAALCLHNDFTLFSPPLTVADDALNILSSGKPDGYTIITEMLPM
jgi:hypothetical protein